MTTLHRIFPRVQPASRRGLATLESWLTLAPPATVLPFTVGQPPRPRALKGGAIVAGRFYRGGSYLPASAASPAPAAFEPSPADAAFDAAFCLARDGELDPYGWPAGDQLANQTTETLVAFLAGRDAGHRERRTAIANPSDGWPAWTDRVRWTIASDDDGPSPQPPTFDPSPDEEANALGFDLVMAGEDPVPPRDWSYSRLVAFFEGVKAAWKRLETDRLESMDNIDHAEYSAWLDTMLEPERDIPYAEMVEALGCHAASNPHYFAS